MELRFTYLPNCLALLILLSSARDLFLLSSARKVINNRGQQGKLRSTKESVVPGKEKTREVDSKVGKGNNNRATECNSLFVDYGETLIVSSRVK